MGNDIVFDDEYILSNLMRLTKIKVKENSYEEYKEVNNLEEKIAEFYMMLLEGKEVGVDFNKLECLDRKPSWLDEEKIKIGQQFASDFYMSISCAEVVSLTIALCNDIVLRKLIFTDKSSEPYTAFKRYISTGERVKSWLTQDLFDEKSNASVNIRKVNCMHRAFYNKLSKIDKEDFYKVTELTTPTPSVCPFIRQDLSKSQSVNLISMIKYNNLPINQTELLGTLVTFVSFVILYPEKFGIDSSKYAYELECFVHLWRYIAYRLGTQDKFNLCSGSYTEVKLKSKVFVDVIFKKMLIDANSEWEHMSRSMVDGIRYYTQGFSYETYVLFALDLLEIDHDNLNKNVSTTVKLELKLRKFLFYYIIPTTWIRRLLTKGLFIKIDKVLNNMPTKEEFYKKEIGFVSRTIFKLWRSIKSITLQLLQGEKNID